uniref:Uncharacterized protein n=1 Tax=Periophthalmus magnuspinnatus TaxID=409849 RepID=A0A3B4AVR5_9GOBI
MEKPRTKKEKVNGNQACQQGEYALAVHLYSEALSADPQNCILYSNRSAAYLRLGQYSTALDDAIKARLINPKWPKVRGRTPSNLVSLPVLGKILQKVINHSYQLLFPQSNSCRAQPAHMPPQMCLSCSFI